jgi:hypothetical protein
MGARRSPATDSADARGVGNPEFLWFDAAVVTGQHDGNHEADASYELVVNYEHFDELVGGVMLRVCGVSGHHDAGRQGLAAMTPHLDQPVPSTWCTAGQSTVLPSPSSSTTPRR